MANSKTHWAMQLAESSDHPNAGAGYAGGRYLQACGRKYTGDVRSHNATDFAYFAGQSPDLYCSDCAKAARLALAAESAPKPDTVIWPKPRPISEARETEIFGYCPDIGWRRLSQTGRKWALTGAEHIADYEPTHFLPLPPEVL